MELVITLGILFLLTIYVMVNGKIQETKRNARYRKKLQESYGSIPERGYETDDLESIPRLFEHERENAEFVLDDITWNDLDMDRIFLLMNHTQSASGAEYLYHMLRTPRQNGKDMDEMERMITYFMEHEQIRLDLQMILHGLGKSGRFSLYDYMDYLDTLGKKSNLRHWIGLGLLILSIALIFIQTTFGVCLLLCISAYQIATYLSEKNKVMPYLSSFAYITRMEIGGEKISEKLNDELGAFRKQLTALLKSLTSFKRGYRILTGMNVSTGNPVELVFDYIKMITHVDLIKFNTTLHEVQGKRSEIMELAKVIGSLDAYISIGAFRASLPYYCVPELSNEEQKLSVLEGFHPSIANPVANSLEQTRGMLVTGSNASGKSTFLKMTAIQAILAQTVHTCAAKAYRGNFFQIYSSMALRDNLDSGESYYIVEIKALKRIVDAADRVLQGKSDNPLLCFVDEVLRGTNTVERIAASTKILEKLSKQNIFCFAATHDIELTHLLENSYDNFHFEEEVSKGDVLFSYRILPGRAVSRNAIKLLQIIGFDDTIIQNADDLAAGFLKTGEWVLEES